MLSTGIGRNRSVTIRNAARQDPRSLCFGTKAGRLDASRRGGNAADFVNKKERQMVVSKKVKGEVTFDRAAPLPKERQAALEPRGIPVMRLAILRTL